jgi:hypothetical protein
MNYSGKINEPQDAASDLFQLPSKNHLWCRRPACLVQPGRPHHKIQLLFLDNGRGKTMIGPPTPIPFLTYSHAKRAKLANSAQNTGNVAQWILEAAE